MARTLARQAILQMMYLRLAGSEADEEALHFVYDIMEEIKEPEAGKVYMTKDDHAYIDQTLQGTAEKEGELDEIIARYLSEDWSMERMAHINLCILRLAVFELLHNDKVPDNVAISEALRLADLYSDPGSKSFINGLLRSVLQSKTPSEARE